MYAHVFPIAIAILLSSVAVQAAANESLPLAGTHFGNPSFGGGAGNKLFEYQSSYRFRAPRSGTVTRVSFQNRTQKYSQMKERCDKGSKTDCDCVKNGLDEYTCGYLLSNPYSRGNGGHQVVTLRTDDRGYPSSTVLATALIPTSYTGGYGNGYVPLITPDSPELKLDRGVYVTRGKVYHLVWTNSRPPVKCPKLVSISEAKKCDRDRGHVSLNGQTFNLDGFRNSPPLGPYYGGSTAWMYRPSASAGWKTRETGHPYTQLIYSDGSSFGEWQTGENGLDSNIVVRVTPSSKGRQRFTVTGADRIVDGFWLANVFRKSGNSDGDLTVRITGGGVNATLTLPASSIPQCKSCTKAKNEASKWTYFSLGKDIKLAKGTAYIFEMSTAKSGDYRFATTYPRSKSYGSGDAWENSVVEKQSGSSWVNARNKHADISLLFTIRGQPRQNP